MQLITVAIIGLMVVTQRLNLINDQTGLETLQIPENLTGRFWMMPFDQW